MKQINWGIIGCGDVTEVKSGPAFSKVSNSRLVAVMRRDATKAKDYAERHKVPRWYSNAEELISDAEVNAVYIATPPSSHASYAIAAIRAGKPVYVEKPMALNFETAQEIVGAAETHDVKLVVAHYRRQWPLFKKIKQLLNEKAIGDIRLARLEFYKTAMKADEMSVEKNAWRIDPAIAGGGLFNDLAPHQLDILFYYFGAAEKITGIATNQAGQYAADDLVAGNILFESGMAFSGVWSFAASYNNDFCEIIGSDGSIRFGFFNNNRITLTTGAGTTHFDFDALQHVQQPMIEQTVKYFLGEADNPCSGKQGAEIMRWIDRFTTK